MSLDGKILRRAKNRLDEMRRNGEAEQSLRLARAYKLNPRIREIDDELRSTVIDAMGLALSRGTDPEEAIAEIREENLFLQEERVRELVGAGLPADYTDEKFMCPICRDTGYNGTKICACLMEIYRQEQAKELSSMLDMGKETFDNFNLEYYDDTPDPMTGISPRSNMDLVYEVCVRYAETFGKKSKNLFMSGSTGLGKTFLSTCIAKVVSEKGYSVVYDTAGSIFARFEDEKFSKDDDTASARADVNRYLTCDLLIIDDLGTELTTAFVTSALYNLINTRLITGKKTIISSNSTMQELRSKYSPQIMSRLQGEYEVLSFYGRDIRLLKKERRL